MYGPGDVRVETLDDPTILKPTDAILRYVTNSAELQRRAAIEGRATHGKCT